MEIEFVTLFFIVLAAYLCPLIAALIPKKLIPETVFFLIAGIILGPNCLNLASPDTVVAFLSDLGLGFLFLLAGYEINPKELTGREGRYGIATWLVTLVLAIAIVALVPTARENITALLAVAITLTTTAFGTIMPILHERKIIGTTLGKSIIAYGAWGEILPIIAIALILTTRKTWITIVILLAFAIIAIICAVVPARIWEKSKHLANFIAKNADTNSQMTVRSVMVLLVGLVAVSAVFDLDIVLGAFAAGFALRFIVPAGDAGLEHKLNGIGYGFFIPLFFIVSGMNINPAAVTDRPFLLLLFIGALLIVRTLPIFISMKINPETRNMNIFERITVALYCTTALPLIVAVVTIATGVGALSTNTGSILVAAGGITVFLMPVLAAVTTKLIKHDTNSHDVNM